MTHDTQSEIKELETIQDVLSHPGFKLIEADLLTSRGNLNNVMSVKDESQLKITQGRVQQIDIFLNLAGAVEQRLKQLTTPQTVESSAEDGDISY